MTDQHSASWKRTLKPYIFITVAGLLAFAPVGFMLRALKNDIIALEYPINYFISQSIHNGEAPTWFNTWGMGFPLQSNLTWGPFSTPQVAFSSLFNYNIYILHIEFMFFVLLSGWGMFHLLRHHFLKDEKLAQLLATCYMLSGFMVGSSQWLLYITAAAFVPIVIGSLLALLKKPSAWYAIQFAVMYTLMFTSVYAAFNIITTYSLLVFVPVYLISKKYNGRELKRVFLYLIMTVVFIALLCFPCLYYTMELLQYIGRGDAIEANTVFFNSNYLHPAALSNMLLPLSSVKMNYPNTEGTMLNSYAGLLVLLLLPAAIIKTIREKNRAALLVLLTTLFFLFTSFGKITFLRDALNVLPGFSYFRNPAIFRFYFLVALVLFLAVLYKDTVLEDLLAKQGAGKLIKYTAIVLSIICLVVLLLHIKSAGSISFSVSELVRNISLGQAIFISAVIQLAVLLLLLVLMKKRNGSMVMLVLTTELIINTLICTPFFTVSSYSLAEANQHFHSEKGFPIQTTIVSEVAAAPQDARMNTWYNVNVYRKQVSSQPTYRGPLTLKIFAEQAADSADSKYFSRQIAFIDPVSAGSLKIVEQRPAHIQVEADLNSPAVITALQNHYPGWKVYYNDQPVEFVNKDKPGLSVKAPAGKGVIYFRYEKKQVWQAAMLLHILVAVFFIAKVIRRVRNVQQRTQ